MKGKCVHCLQETESITRDHIFPRSWYPSDFPENVERWTAPSCRDCNQKYSVIEEDLLIKLGLAVASEHAYTKSVRALSPSAGQNERDKRIREAKRQSILRSFAIASSFPPEAFFPGFSSQNVPLDEQGVAIPVSADNLRAMSEKVVRGVFWVMDKAYIDPPFKVMTFVLAGEGAEHFRKLLDPFAVLHELPNVLAVKRAVAAEDGRSSAFQIKFWNKVELFAIVSADED